MQSVSVGLIGDYDEGIVAHRAIPLALSLASQACGIPISTRWLPTGVLEKCALDTIAQYTGFWCVPGSPYRSMNGALRAIQFARENHRPFLGTCGGSQHAIIEYARDVVGLTEADHAESNPDAELAIITQLACPLIEVSRTIFLKPKSQAAVIYGKSEITEIFNCRFSFNADYLPRLNSSQMRISGVDETGEARLIELADHPFFIATQFQPERAALAGRNHPLIAAFVKELMR